jgi:hypothetical protein
VDRKTTSWGGSVKYNPADKKFWMFAAEMANHCTLGQWTTNSQVNPLVQTMGRAAFLALPALTHSGPPFPPKIPGRVQDSCDQLV